MMRIVVGMDGRIPETAGRLGFMYIRFLSILLALTPAWSQTEVVATGLQAPNKIILTARGNVLVSETSTTPNSGRVSMVPRGGARRSLLENLPSGTEVTLAGGSGPSAMALRERTLYLAIGTGDAERSGAVPGTTMHNPLGATSPLFSSILAIRFSADVDAIGGTFRMTADHQRTLADGWDVELEDGAGATAQVSVLIRFRSSEPDANSIYRFSNPWGMALTEDGKTLYVTDASQNVLARVDTATGRSQRLLRFAPVPNPTPVGPPVLDAVPTSVRFYRDQLIVSFLSGFPFVPGGTKVLAINPEKRTSELFIQGLTSATDILWRAKADGVEQFYVLEFSRDQSATPPGQGSLLMYDSPQKQVILDNLIAPVSMAYEAATRDLYIVELTGRLLRLRLEQ